MKKPNKKKAALHGSRNRIAVAAIKRSGAGVHSGQGEYNRHPKHKNQSPE